MQDVDKPQPQSRWDNKYTQNISNGLALTKIDFSLKYKIDREIKIFQT